MDSHAFSKETPFPKGLKTANLETISLGQLEQRVAAESSRLMNACKDYGFFYLNLKNSETGMELLDVVAKLFPVSQQVFELPQAEKQQYNLKDKGSLMTSTSSSIAQMLTLSLNSGTKLWLGKDDIMQTGPENPNPNLITSHRKLIQQYIRLCHRVVEFILCGLEKQLGLLPATLIDLHQLSAESGDHVRFLKCPSQPANDRQTAVGEHTDFGSITVLFNRLAGLRVIEPGVHNEWENWPWVPPRSDHAIINLGDAMVKLTNGLFRSNMHRVDSPPSEQASAPRYSLVYFSRPRDDVILKRIEGSDVIPKLPDGVVEEHVCSKDWVLRRAMGKRMGNFQGEEHWDRMQGTEASMKAPANPLPVQPRMQTV